MDTSEITFISVLIIIALQVTLSLSVEEGQYLLVPSTFTANTEREFLVRVWADTRWACSLAGPGTVTVETVRDYKVTQYLK